MDIPKEISKYVERARESYARNTVDCGKWLEEFKKVRKYENSDIDYDYPLYSSGNTSRERRNIPVFFFCIIH